MTGHGVNRDVVAVVPARGGSKGILRKNLQVVGGLSLLARAVRTGVASSLVTRVLVSTEDAEIATAAAAAGAEVVARPVELAGDEASTLAVLRHMCEHFLACGGLPAVFVLLEPTSPLRTPAHVDACVEKILSGVFISAATVVSLERNPYNIFTVDQNGQARRFVTAPAGSFSRRQDFTHLKRINGCVYAFTPGAVATGSILQDPLALVDMTGYEPLNIDSPSDLELARIIFNTHYSDF